MGIEFVKFMLQEKNLQVKGYNQLFLALFYHIVEFTGRLGDHEGC